LRAADKAAPALEAGFQTSKVEGVVVKKDVGVLEYCTAWAERD